MTYSELNAFTPFRVGWLSAKSYWVAYAALLLVATGLLWLRGEERQWGARLRTARRRFTKPMRAAALVAGALWVVFGGWIFYNTNVVHQYTTAHAAEAEQVETEKNWRSWKGRPQPKIVDVNLEVDLFPRDRDARIRGRYLMRNRSDVSIDELLLRLPFSVDVDELRFSQEHRILEEDEAAGYRRVKLTPALAPGEETELHFDLRVTKDGFANQEGGLGVLPNGSFVQSQRVLPAFGYEPGGEVSDPRRRRKFGLEERDPLPPFDDPWGRAHHGLSLDSDWLTFEAVVSTSADQIALAPGDLVKEWSEGDRRFFQYRSAVPILKFFTFISGDYEVTRDRWEDVELEIYHDPDHDYNVKTMMRSMKKTLAYMSEAFGAYPHKTLRIVEFPRYARFAQSFPTVIPFSESIGFIARLEDPDDVDYPYYVTAHEVAHQWWGHKVTAARTEGATAIIESLSQYSALRVMEKQYGSTMIGKFLRYELDRYLVGRSADLRDEVPLAKVQTQQHIHYNKGSLVTLGPARLIGPEEMDRILAEFVELYAYQEAPYPTTMDLVALIKERVPEEIVPVVEDLYDRITIFDFETVEAECTELGDGTFEVALTVEAAKNYADGEGRLTEAPMFDLIEVGVFGERQVLRKTKPKELVLERRQLQRGENEVRFVVSEKPLRAGVDPYYRRVDSQPWDNEKDLTCRPAASNSA